MFTPRRKLTLVIGCLGLLGFAFLLWNSWESRRIREARGAVDRREFTTALQLLQAELGESGGDAESLLLAARTARRANQSGAADRYLRRYAEQRHQDPEIFAIERILVSIQRGEVDQFGGGLRFCEAQPNHPETPYVLEAMAVGYLKVGNLVGSLESANRWIATNPRAADAAYAHILRATCLKMVGNLDDARKETRTALDLAPYLLDAHSMMGELLSDTDPKAALQHWQTVLEADPTRIEAHLGIVRCHRTLGEMTQASLVLERALKIQPDSQAAILERARLALDNSDYKSAVRDAQTVLAHDGKSRAAMTLLAQAYQATGREAEAGELRKKVLAIEEELYKIIQEKVSSGALPAPQKGTTIQRTDKP